jgi:hypothetical protein
MFDWTVNNLLKQDSQLISQINYRYTKEQEGAKEKEE